MIGAVIASLLAYMGDRLQQYMYHKGKEEGYIEGWEHHHREFKRIAATYDPSGHAVTQPLNLSSQDRHATVRSNRQAH